MLSSTHNVDGTQPKESCAGHHLNFTTKKHVFKSVFLHYCPHLVPLEVYLLSVEESTAWGQPEVPM